MTADPREPGPVLPADADVPAEVPAGPAAGGAPSRRPIRRWAWVVVGIAIVVLIVVVLAPLASPDPDGLESVATQQGWIAAAQDAAHGLLPGYDIPGLGGSAGTIVSGLLGVGIVLLAILGLGWLLRRRAPRDR